MSISEQLQDSEDELQSMQQQNKIMSLEITEYQKEIHNLKQENQKLLEQNNELYELINLEQNKNSHSDSLSKEIELINSHNMDLSLQITRYKNLTKRLNCQCQILQTANSKYNIVVEQFNKTLQQKNKNHKNEIIKLRNKIRELENECDTWSEKYNSSNTFLYSLKSLSELSSINCVSNDTDITVNRIKSVESNINRSNPLYNELHIESANYDSDMANPSFHLRCTKSSNIATSPLFVQENRINILQKRIKDLEFRNNELQFKLNNEGKSVGPWHCVTSLFS